MAKRKYLTSKDLIKTDDLNSLVNLCKGCYFNRHIKEDYFTSCKLVTHPNVKEIIDKLGNCTERKGNNDLDSWKYFIYKRKKK